MTREVQSVILFLVGGALLRISAGDVFMRYVKESMRPWLLISGALLVLAGVFVLIDVVRAARRGDVPDDDPAVVDVDEHAAEGGHDHGHHGPRSAWLLVLPVAAIFLIAPPALGAFTAGREASSVAQPADADVPPLPPGNPVTVMLADYAARAVWDDGRTLKGRTVEMTGFVTPNPKGGWWLTRLQLACCAADAIPTKIHPVGGPESLPANTWVKVVGEWVPGGGTQSDTAIPWVKVDSLAKVEEPRNPYE